MRLPLDSHLKHSPVVFKSFHMRNDHLPIIFIPVRTPEAIEKRVFSSMYFEATWFLAIPYSSRQ